MGWFPRTGAFWGEAKRPALFPWMLVAAFTLLGCGGDDEGTTAPPQNRPPALSIDVLSDLRAVVDGDVVRMIADADDPDDPTGASLSYQWSLAGPEDPGSLDDPTAEQVDYQPGNSPGEVRVSCTVSDGVVEVTRTTFLLVGTAVPGGTIRSDTTWSAQASPFVVLDDLTVAVGVRWTLEPGVQIFVRPVQMGQDFRRPRLLISGELVAEGTGFESDQRIRVEGGRNGLGTDKQHQGLIFNDMGSGRLRWLVVQDGDVGVDHRSSGSLELEHCTLTDNGSGFSGIGGSSVEIRRCKLTENSVGVTLIGASARIIYTRISANGSQGLSLSARSQELGRADVDSSVIDRNEKDNVRVNNNLGGTVELDIRHSNLGILNAAEVNVHVAAPTCLGIDLSLRENYWGLIAESGAEILRTFANQRDCNAGVSDWTLEGGDWTNRAHDIDEIPL
jgi:hypothetical protein